MDTETCPICEDEFQVDTESFILTHKGAAAVNEASKKRNSDVKVEKGYPW